MVSLHAMRLAAGMALLCALALPAGEARAQKAAGDDEAIVLRYPPSSVRVGLAIGGVVATGAAYGLGALCASIWPEEEIPGADALFIPVAGPWISLARNDCATDNPDCDVSKHFRGVLLVLGGLVQAAGLGLVAESIFLTTESQPTQSGQTQSQPEKSAATITVLPIGGARWAGLAAAGTF